jgi:hypothetical protein
VSKCTDRHDLPIILSFYGLCEKTCNNGMNFVLSAHPTFARCLPVQQMEVNIPIQTKWQVTLTRYHHQTRAPIPQHMWQCSSDSRPIQANIFPCWNVAFFPTGELPGSILHPETYFHHFLSPPPSSLMSEQ